jgi:hypothetical protein
MNTKKLAVILILICVTIGVGVVLTRDDTDHTKMANHAATSAVPSHPMTSTASASQVPAHYTSPPKPGSLGPTLSPEQYSGKAREAYIVARAIPQTLAQLPCYCHCDRGMGHKSLHSCFEDDHAANCATCIEEALLAYRLQTKDHLSPEQVRERIIEQYGD